MVIKSRMEGKNVKIIYEDTEKLIVEKPAGVLTQSARSFDTDLVSEVLTYRRSRKETAYAAVINRLDRPVGGLVLFAKTKQAAARLSKEMQQNTLNKQYYALICGKPEQSKGTFVDYLQKDAKANLSKVVSKESKEAKRAELEYEVLKTVYVQAHEQMPVTLVKIHLITGRHHQIRVQFASRGLPLLGDTRYGGQTEADCRMALQKSGKPLIQRYEIALCAYALTVDKKTYELALPWQV